ncbi:methylmalonyl-CoA mutase family protein [Bacteroidota bacterium]
MPEIKKLFSEFPPIPSKEWESKIMDDLKGADYEKKLIWKSDEDINVKPYYRKENLDNLDYLNTIPGQYPYTRGNQADKNNWLVRQNIKVDNPIEVNRKVLQIFDKGVNSVLFELDNTISAKNLFNLLKNISFDRIEINFNAHINTNSLVKKFLSFLKNSSIELSQIKGGVGFDTIGNLVINGNYYFIDENKSFNQLNELFSISRELPKLRLITINGKHFHNAGGTIIQELAFSLTIGNDYLAKLTELGLTIDEIAPKIDFSYAIGSNYFFEIAKIRAARLLWANIVNAYNPVNSESCQTYIHAETSKWNKTLFDPHLNILRSTTEAMAATLGGINSLTIYPYNSSFEKPTELSERIARNQQLIISEEAYFSKIKDPSAGSYYIENLTNEIAEKSWELFQKIEKEGGFIKAFINGIIQNQIKDSAQKKDFAIANRKEILLGTNQYPNLIEEIKPISIKNIDVNDNIIVKPIKLYRGAIAFEELRLKTENYSKSNKRPVVFLLTYGNLAMSRARAQFSTNFFGCAGFEIIDNKGFALINKGIINAKNAKANIIVFCSSDDEYNDLNSSIIDEINNEIIIVAGYPKAIIEKLYAIGISNFIHIKSNVIEELKKFQDLLNI